MADHSATPTGRPIEAIFSEALSQPPDERAQYVAGACGDDLRLRARVEALLRAHAAPEGFLPEQGGDLLPDLNSAGEEPLGATAKSGETIGRYKLVEQIGEGGFGSVYVAEQKEPVKRRVALKLIKLGMDTKQVVARFQAERQALALMDHPSIAKVFDAGATDTGRPYFVMELVQGTKITEHCERNQLSLRQRLELFIQVCHAVQHAHQKGIIHRDLKPSNILVTLRDGQPVPKIIDFGIAKATQVELTEQTVFTQFGQFIGTPAYISPEQAELSRLDIDTRSDIYSLGVLLYELLTGTTPFETKALVSGGWEEMRRTIKHQAPPRPSTRLSRELTANQTASAQSKIKNQNSKISSDLDWIVMKCLEKDRTRRYATANGLASDIQRHLNNEPVVARPRSRFYELQKTVRRHKAGFAATGLVIAALGFGLIVSTRQTLRARRAESDETRLRLEAERARSNATEKLWNSYLAEARARRHSGESGQRLETLAAVSNAAAIRPSLELRNEAIAAVALVDIRLLPEKTKHFKHQQEYASVDATLERYAVGDTNGAISIRRVADDVPILTLPPIKPGLSVYWSIGFVRNTDLLWAGYKDKWYRFWNLTSAKVVWELPMPGIFFSSDYRALATFESNHITLHDVTRQAEVKRLVTESPLSNGAFHPNGRRLFTLEDTDIVVMDIEQEKTLFRLSHPMPLLALAWHPGGVYLASACADNLIYVWNGDTGQKVRALEGHTGNPVSLDFSHDGRFLVSGGWDGQTFVWDFGSGRPLVKLSGTAAVHFGVDGRRLCSSGWDLNQLDFLEFTAGREVQTIFEKGRVAGAPHGNVRWSASGRWLVYDTPHRIVIYDVQAQRELGSIPEPNLYIWGFGPGDASVLGVRWDNGQQEGQICAWPVQSAGSGLDLKVGPVRLGAKTVGGAICLSSDRELGVCVGGGRAQVFRTGTLTEVARTEVQPDMRFAAFSLDDKLLATGAFHDFSVKVWQAETGGLLRVLPTTDDICNVCFSPDGRWLVVQEIEHYQFWDTSSWSPVRSIARLPSFPSAVAFAPDGKILAGMDGTSKVKLFYAKTGEDLGTLDPPTSWPVTDISFSPDGTQLAVCEGHCALRVWNLRAIREQLAKMHLDWDLPPYPIQLLSTPPK